MVLVDISTATFELLRELGLERAIDILKARDVFKQLGLYTNDVVVLNYKDGVLTLGVFNSVWHQEIESLKDKLIKQLNELSTDIKFGKILIKEIAYDNI